MKTIYIDSDFKCHVSNDDTMRAVETDFFDGKCKGGKNRCDGEGDPNSFVHAPATSFPPNSISIARPSLSSSSIRSEDSSACMVLRSRFFTMGCSRMMSP